MHYLEAELRKLMSEDPATFDFVEMAALDGMWYWDLEQPDHEWMGPTFWRTLGYDPADRQHLAEEWQGLIDPDDLQLALANFERHKADPSHPYDQVVRYTHKDGSTVWVRCRGRIIFDDGGNAVRMLGAHTDVTHLKQLEAELREANKHLDRFAATAAHDLRSPARHIQQLVSMILEDHSDALPFEVRMLLGKVQDRAAWSMTLMEDLLRYAKASQQVEATTFPLGGVVARVQERLSDRSGGRQLQVRVEGDTDVLAPEAGVEQVLQALLDNALVFRRQSPELEINVTCVRRSSDWLVSVEDNGQGVPADQLEAIFRPFHRLHGQSHVPGTGLGLAISHRLVESMGGRIWAEASGCGGLAVRFTLPFQSQQPSHLSVSTGLEPGVRRLSSALMIDDSADDIMFATRELERSGRVDQIRSVRSIEQALELYRDPEARADADPDGFPPEVILLDISMDGGSGIEFLKRLRAMPLGVEWRPKMMVVVSGLDRAAIRHQLPDDGLVDRVLSKPLTRHDVVAIAEIVGEDR